MEFYVYLFIRVGQESGPLFHADVSGAILKITAQGFHGRVFPSAAKLRVTACNTGLSAILSNRLSPRYCCTSVVVWWAGWRDK